MLWQLIVDTKNTEEARKMFSVILTVTETEAVKKRLAVAYWLTKKRSYENIKNNLKVSSATIATINSEMNKPGWKTALEKVMAEEWATKWEEKIKKMIKR